jgi:hypothetical protein
MNVKFFLIFTSVNSHNVRLEISMAVTMRIAVLCNFDTCLSAFQSNHHELSFENRNKSQAKYKADATQETQSHGLRVIKWQRCQRMRSSCQDASHCQNIFAPDCRINTFNFAVSTTSVRPCILDKNPRENSRLHKSVWEDSNSCHFNFHRRRLVTSRTSRTFKIPHLPLPARLRSFIPYVELFVAPLLVPRS